MSNNTTMFLMCPCDNERFATKLRKLFSFAGTSPSPKLLVDFFQMDPKVYPTIRIMNYVQPKHNKLVLTNRIFLVRCGINQTVVFMEHYIALLKSHYCLVFSCTSVMACPLKQLINCKYFQSMLIKVKNDHHSKFSNLSNWKEEA